MQWALAGKLQDTPLLGACLHDQRHDMQVEDSRAGWLWQLIQAVNGVDRFRCPILDALTKLPDSRSAYQLCELAYFYAAMGDEPFRTRLYDIVQQKPLSNSPRLGEEAILRLDGKSGFLFAAEVRGDLLAERAWEWDDGSLIYDAVEQVGEAQIEGLLKNATDKSVKRFHEEWIREKAWKAGRKRRPSHKEVMQAIPVDEIIAEAEKERPAIGLFRGWGMHAPEDDLNAVLRALWSAERPKVMVNFLRIFSNRPLPVFDPRLIGFCSHRDEDVRRWAFKALEMNAHPLVREFAIANLAQGLGNRPFIALLIRNYAKGDEARILKAMQLPEDVDELHWLLMDIIKLLENNDEADPSTLALVAYAHTPCENCRFDAVRILHSHNLAPEWMAEECRYDSLEECRCLF